MLRRLLFLNFRTVYALDRWLRVRFSTGGATLIALAITGAVFGINTRQTLSYQLFALSAAALVFSFVCSLRFRPRLQVRRLLPRFATVGETARWVLELHNLGPRVERGLTLLETPVAAAPTPADFFREREPANSRRNWFDRHVGYPRWVSFMRRREGALAAEVTLPDLVPGLPARVEVEVTPTRRGYLELAVPALLRPDPLGLCRAVHATGAAGRLLVLPRRYPMPALALPGRTRRPPGTAARATLRAGGSDDFAMLRDYRPGDPLRHLHWKAWARLGTPVVMEFHDRSRMKQVVLLDTADADGDRERFEAAVAAAASVIAALPGAGREGAEVELVCHSSRLADAASHLEALACVQPSAAHTFAGLADAALRVAASAAGFICVLLAWDEVRQQLVQRLRAHGVEVLVLLVLAEDAVAPTVSGSVHERMLAVIRPSRIAADLAVVGASTGSRQAA